MSSVRHQSARHREGISRCNRCFRLLACMGILARCNPCIHQPARRGLWPTDGSPAIRNPAWRHTRLFRYWQRVAGVGTLDRARRVHSGDPPRSQYWGLLEVPELAARIRGVLRGALRLGFWLGISSSLGYCHRRRVCARKPAGERLQFECGLVVVVGSASSRRRYSTAVLRARREGKHEVLYGCESVVSPTTHGRAHATGETQCTKAHATAARFE